MNSPALTLPPQAIPPARAATRPQAANVRHFVPATRFNLLTTALSWTICSIVMVFFLIDSRTSESGGCRHWFVIPAFLCGVIIAHDLVDWLRGRFDVFDPVGLIGIFGFHWFFVAPLLQVDHNWWLIDVSLRPADPRTWLGWISVANFMGLLIYRYLRNPLTGPARTSRRVWILQNGTFGTLVTVVLAVSLVTQIYLYSLRGGIRGFIEAYSSGALAQDSETVLSGMIAECFPIVALMGYCVAARKSKTLASWPAIAVAMFAFFVLALLFGGLRGSRSNTMYQLFWAVGMIHFFVRPISKKLVLVGLVIVFSFAYFYAVLYKKGGIQNFEEFQSGTSLSDLERKANLGRYTDSLLLAELSRTELQGFIIHQICRPGSDIQLAWGRTYAATLSHIIPAFIWSDRPVLLQFEATEMLLGRGTYDPEFRRSSFVHGMVGEGMLNFGLAAIPLLFLIWTFLVARIRKWVLTWDRNDSRLLMAGWLVCICIAIFMSDSNNMLFFVFKYAGIPFLILSVCSARFRLPKFSPWGAPSYGR